jgi:8-oxo-dGTP diphosphatase
MKHPIPFASAIIENEGKILIQTRWKPNVSPKYSGLIEIPGGAIEYNEDIFESLKREVYEECGVDIHIESNGNGFKPFYCVQFNDGEIHFVGYFFICKYVKGDLKESSESKNPKWVDINELKEILSNNKVFPLHRPALEQYVIERE